MRAKDVYLTRKEYVKEYNNTMKVRIGLSESIEEILRKNPLTLSNEDKNRLVDLIVKKRDAEDKLKRLREMFEGRRVYIK